MITQLDIDNASLHAEDIAKAAEKEFQQRFLGHLATAKQVMDLMQMSDEERDTLQQANPDIYARMSRHVARIRGGSNG